MKKLGSEVCCYCESPAQTHDHVVPESWFPRAARRKLRLPTVPCCFPCNQRHSTSEEKILRAMVLCLSDDNPVRSLVPKVLRSLDPRAARNDRDAVARKRSLDRLVAATTFVPSGDPGTRIVPGTQIHANQWNVLDSGLVARGSWAFPFEEVPFTRVFEKLARGLMMARMGQRLPASIKAKAVWPKDGAETQRIASLVQVAPNVVDLSPTLWAAFVRASDHPCGSLWLFRVFSQFTFAGVLTPEGQDEDA